MSGFIDVHHHILPERYVAEVGAAKVGGQGSSGRVPEWSIADALRKMDAHGIATAITSISAPGIPLESRDARRALARWCNEFAADLTVRHPGRFGMFATLALPDVDASLEEIAFAYDTCKADGICLLSNYGGLYFDDPRYRPVFGELNRRRSVVFVHPTSPQAMMLVGGLSASTLEFTFDTARAIAALIFGGVIRDFPDIRFIFSHAGGALPYLAGRIDVLTRNNPKLKEYIPQGMAAELRKMYFDTALSANRATFATLLALVGEENILFGSDYPFGPRNQIEDAVASLGALGLSAASVRRLGRETALQLFPRFS